MKIGEFAKQHHTSIDTIRHYMDLGLINPEKVGGLFYFDALCHAAYGEIQFLKAMGLSLKDIAVILHYKRLGQLTGYEGSEGYAALFKQKYEAIESEIAKLSEQRDGLRAFIGAKPEVPLPKGLIGIPLEAMAVLNCTSCKGAFVLEQGRVENGQILSGILACHCGESLRIDEGILYGDGHLDHASEPAMTGAFLDDYLQSTDQAYLHKITAGLEWTQRHVDFSQLQNSVALELGSGHGFFLRHFLGHLPEDCLYIAVDHDPQALRWLKSAAERIAPKVRLLFLCADFRTMPLKDGMVDHVFDISGSSNVAFSEVEFLLKTVQPKFKPHCHLLGYYIIFNKFAFHSKVEPEHRLWFKRGNIDAALEELGFKAIGSLETDPVESGGPMEDYFVKGEQVSSYVYFGKR